MSLDDPTPLLGGLSPAQFMRRHWQKKPKLIRQAVPGVRSPVGRAALFALAADPAVESRLIAQRPGRGSGWTLKHGPFERRALPALSQPGWTLLVQGLDLHVAAAHELLGRFRFVPEARLDDLMISYASDGGGVGPHFDSYDVFLLQVQGRRRWRIGRQRDLSLQPGVPLKILAHFEPEEEFVLEPGDMLYLPPRWAHDGVADGECMTCSIGFRAAGRDALARELLQTLLDRADEAEAGEGAEAGEDGAPPSDALGRDPLYRDPDQPATDTPGRIPEALQRFAAEGVARLLRDAQALRMALGECMSEPKPGVAFDPDGDDDEPWSPAQGLRLDARSRMLYDDRCVYLNGESFRAGGRDARLLRQLADRRQLSPRDAAGFSGEAVALIDDWVQAGWLHPHGGTGP